ncbi:hypothetical protein JCM11251_004571 [Rhodosporidiobolus azoricus]
MPSWAERRRELDELLRTRPARSTSSRDEQLHLELLAEEVAQDRPGQLSGPSKRLRTAALSPSDFPSLTILSSTGSFGRVELVRPSSSLSIHETAGRSLYVMKTVDRRWAFRMREQQFLRHELTILRLARQDPSASSRIPRLVASFLSTSSFHLVLDHAAGGDVWSVLERKNIGIEPGKEVGLPEAWVRPWMAELVDALEWLHNQGWVHRDVKPQNLLLRADGHLLLTDYGSAAPLSPNHTSIARQYCRALTGTPDYIAPEVLLHAEKVYEQDEDDEEDFGAGGKEVIDLDERAYGAEVDIWACGVVLYELLTGQAPFFAEEISDTYERIINWQDHLTFSSSTSMSKSAKQAIQTLLVAANDRPTFATIRLLPWFAGTEWHKLRQSPPPYIPLAFQPPPSSPSFTRSAHSFTTAKDLDYSSFFSSPGLSVLRPSPRTAESARSDERQYWEGRELGGLTTLPGADEFDQPFCTSSAIPDTAPAPRSSSPYETPARPIFRPLHAVASSGLPSPFTPTRGAEGTPGSSGRSRRMISEIDAWREMQEHAWVVGMSARKQWRESGAGPTMQASPRPAMMAQKFDSTARARQAVSYKVREQEKEKENCRQVDGLGGLEQRQQEMLSRLEEMDRKFEKLFALAAKDVGGQG